MMANPSGFYAKGRNRSPAHDAMQAEMLEFLRRRAIGQDGGNVRRRSIEVEMPIVQNGRVQAFVDLAEIWEFDGGKVINLYEIKPIVESVGGLIRQCKALQVLCAAAEPDAIVSCSAVVPWDDPDLLMLKASYRWVWAWGVRFEVDKVADDVDEPVGAGVEL